MNTEVEIVGVRNSWLPAEVRLLTSQHRSRTNLGLDDGELFVLADSDVHAGSDSWPTFYSVAALLYPKVPVLRLQILATSRGKPPTSHEHLFNRRLTFTAFVAGKGQARSKGGCIGRTRVGGMAESFAEAGARGDGCHPIIFMAHSISRCSTNIAVN